MAAEEWRSVVGLEGAYEVSSLGRVRRVPQVVERISKLGIRHGLTVRGGMLKPQVVGGSASYHFYVNGRQRGITINRLVAEAFGPYALGRRLPQTWMDRLMDKISPEPNSGCWLWMGAISKGTGYGSAWIKGATRGVRGRLTTAHRVVYRALKGEIPNGYELDHKCRNRLCVNPDHLEPVTSQVNAQRGAKVKRALKPFNAGMIR